MYILIHVRLGAAEGTAAAGIVHSSAFKVVFFASTEGKEGKRGWNQTGFCAVTV